MDQVLNETDFAKYPDGLVPAIIQDVHTRKVLMLGYMSRDSLQKTLETSLVTFFSRSRQTLWTKGETSGNYLHVVEVRGDCDHDALLVQVRPSGPVCHTGAETCFFEETDAYEKDPVMFLSHLQDIVEDRKHSADDNSYTCRLFAEGINKIAQKVGEEAVELVIEAMDDNRELLLGEAADLFYHTIVLLAYKGFSIQDVAELLRKRHGDKQPQPSTC